MLARCLSLQAGVGGGKAGSVFHHFSLISAQNRYAHGPQCQQHLAREGKCRKETAGTLGCRTHLGYVLRNRSRKDTRKNQILEPRFMLLAPLRPLLGVAKSSGNKYPGCREGRLKPRSWLGGHPSKAALMLPSAPGRGGTEVPQAEHAAWCSQTFLHVADQPVSYHGTKDGSS